MRKAQSGIAKHGRGRVKNRNRNRNRNKPGPKPMTAEQKQAAKEQRALPNPRTEMRRDLFRLFKGEDAIGHEMTCVGRLMIVGCFDGMESDPGSILASLLQYQHAYWGNYGGGPQIAELGKVKGGPKPVEAVNPLTGKVDDPRGERFEDMDALLKSAGRDARRAVHEVTVDRHWFPDEDCEWAERIINSRKLDKRAEFVRVGRPVPECLAIVGELACDSDWAMRDLLRLGASALVGERKKIAA
jgi:hypothetical protein